MALKTIVNTHTSPQSLLYENLGKISAPLDYAFKTLLKGFTHMADIASI